MNPMDKAGSGSESLTVLRATDSEQNDRDPQYGSHAAAEENKQKPKIPRYIIIFQNIWLLGFLLLNLKYLFSKLKNDGKK